MAGRETNAADPVTMAIFLDGVFAFGQCVPQFDRLVTGTRYDLTVVDGEGYGQNVLKEMERNISKLY